MGFGGGVEVPGVSRSLGTEDQPLASPSSPPWEQPGKQTPLIEPVRIIKDDLQRHECWSTTTTFRIQDSAPCKIL